MAKKLDEKRTAITVSLTPDTLKRLDDFCKQNFNAERSTVVEEAVKTFLDEKAKK